MSDASLDEIRGDVEQKLRWLFEEVGRLRQDNRSLRDENEALREEAARQRLCNGTGAAAAPAADEEAEAAPQAIPPLYHQLPPSFTFSTFFELADRRGLGSDEAKRCLLGLIREERLLQKGPRIIKTDAIQANAAQADAAERRPQPATP